MRRVLLFCALLVAAAIPASTQSAPSAGWKTVVSQAMPLLGHRNWILIVDSAYPLQNSSGVETLETNADQLEVTQYVLEAIANSIHVRPVVTMDAELPFVPDQDAPGASAYRAKIAKILHGFPVESVPHEKMLADIDEAGKQFHVLVLKTTMAIPYTSVFIRLDCKYWAAEAEKRMRERMKAAGAGGAGQPSPQAAQ